MQLLNFLVFLSFFSTSTQNFNEKDLLGSWHQSRTLNGVYNFYKGDSKSSLSLFIFEADSKLTLKTVIRDGFCGTAPHNYRSEQGSWKIEGNQLIIKYTRYPRKMNNVIALNQNSEKPKPQEITLNYELIHLDDQQLQLRRIQK